MAAYLEWGPDSLLCRLNEASLQEYAIKPALQRAGGDEQSPGYNRRTGQSVTDHFFLLCFACTTCFLLSVRIYSFVHISAVVVFIGWARWSEIIVEVGAMKWVTNK